MKKIIYLFLLLTNLIVAQYHSETDIYNYIFDGSALRMTVGTGTSLTPGRYYSVADILNAVFDGNALKISLLGSVDSSRWADTSYYASLSTYLIDTSFGFVGVAEAGNLGIGTSTPTTKLDVRGTIRGGNGQDTNQTIFKGVINNNRDLLLNYNQGLFTPGQEIYQWEAGSEIERMMWDFTNTGGTILRTKALNQDLFFSFLHNADNDLDNANEWALWKRGNADDYKLHFTNYNGSGLAGGLWFKYFLTLDPINNIVSLSNNSLILGDSIDGRFTISHSTSDDFLNFYNYGYNVFTVNSDGELGIGTDNPEYQVDIRWKEALQIGSGITEAQSIFKGNAGTNQDIELWFLTNFEGNKAWEWFCESDIKAFNYDFNGTGSMNIQTSSTTGDAKFGIYHGSSNKWLFNARGSGEQYKLVFTNVNGGSSKNILTLDPSNSRVGINDTVPNSTLDVNGSIEAKYTISGTNYNALNNDYTIEMTASGDTLFLPAGSGNKEYTVINVSAGNIIIVADGSETIGNISPSGTLTVATGEARGLVWNGTIWRIKY